MAYEHREIITTSEQLLSAIALGLILDEGEAYSFHLKSKYERVLLPNRNVMPTFKLAMAITLHKQLNAGAVAIVPADAVEYILSRDEIFEGTLRGCVGEYLHRAIMDRHERIGDSNDG